MRKLISIIIFNFLFIVTSISQSLLVKISGNELKKTSYLFGTVHKIEKDSIPLFEKAKQIVPKCKTLAIEVKMENMIAMIGILDKLKLAPGNELNNYFTKEEYEQLSILFKNSSGYDLTLFNKFHPFVIEAIIELNAIGADSNSIFMEAVLQDIAKKNKQSIEGLESMNEQITSILSISIEEQCQSLKEMLKTDINNEIDEVSAVYQKNDAEKIHTIAIKDMSKEAIQVLLDDRNVRMCERLINLIKTKPTFIAVGAAHLGGENGIITLLRKKGYIIEDVSLE